MAGEPDNSTSRQDSNPPPYTGDAEKGTGSATGPQSVPGSTSSTPGQDDGRNITRLDSKVIQDKPREDDLDATLAHLPEHERAILKEQLFIPETKVTFFTLYRYASKKDIIIFVISSICSIAAGAALPLFTVCSFFIRPSWP